MMTTTDRLTAMIHIERGINNDMIMARDNDRAPFTLTRTQLLDRIITWVEDDPSNTTDDITAIYRTMLTDPDLPIR